MSVLTEKIAGRLLNELDPMCSSTGEARKLAEAAVAVFREVLLSDQAVEATGFTMDDWLFRIHGVISSSRPGKDGEAARLLRAALDAVTGDDQ